MHILFDKSLFMMSLNMALLFLRFNLLLGAQSSISSFCMTLCWCPCFRLTAPFPVLKEGTTVGDEPLP